MPDSSSDTPSQASEANQATIADLVKELVDKAHPLVLVETCTGGAVAAAITNQPGASRVLRWALTLYDHASKADLLSIAPTVFVTHASVSQAAVTALAEAALARLQRQDPACREQAQALAISGIAGPTGARPGKPLGHCSMALSSTKGTQTQCLQLAPERSPYREQATRAALTWLLQRA